MSHTESLLVPTAPDANPLAPFAHRIQEYAAGSKAASTKRAYRSDWEDFTRWCIECGFVALPAAPATIAAYLTTQADAGKKASTLGRRLAAIAFAHKAAGHDSPTNSLLVEATGAGIRRQIGTAQVGKAPAVTEDIRAMLAALPATRKGVRDRALLLVGFAGAFRRSELVALNVEDIEFKTAGLVITVRRSKTDQEGEGTRKGIPYGKCEETCPVRALQAWLEATKITTGAIFVGIDRHRRILDRLSDRGVARAVKEAAAAAGLDPTRYSGHSLRAGLATAAAAAGVSERVIMAQTGHKSEHMVRKYIREGSLFRENAAGSVGL
ncbi:MAG: site-specific integrase [Armatimonadota bacterium]